MLVEAFPLLPSLIHWIVYYVFVSYEKNLYFLNLGLKKNLFF